jgi:subfamily B ATP-binding cassette protein MsbA
MGHRLIFLSYIFLSCGRNGDQNQPGKAGEEVEKKFIIDHLLRPHWKALAVAFVAVIVDGMADLFEPWPIKIVLDYVIGSHPLPSWAAGAVIASFGEGKWAILRFAAIATLAITALGAAASYTESYLTIS